MSKDKNAIKFIHHEESKLYYSDKHVHKIIEMWGVWSNNSTGCGWYKQAPYIRNRLSVKTGHRERLCDDDALVIDRMIASMYSPQNEQPMSFFILHYVYGLNKSQIAKQAKCSEKAVRIALMLMGKFVAGMLNQRYESGFKLELDINEYV